MDILANSFLGFPCCLLFSLFASERVDPYTSRHIIHKMLHIHIRMLDILGTIQMYRQIFRAAASSADRQAGVRASSRVSRVPSQKNRQIFRGKTRQSRLCCHMSTTWLDNRRRILVTPTPQISTAKPLFDSHGS